ncbi:MULTISPECIES: hypothetical protein [Rhizobium]|uniref:hypothetical protein n=1 Tax=Rhizobium TaxID=379 RepID=UPI0003717436|nr:MULTISPECIES: hypothetical protein [Rhizobium]MBY3335311.1 peptidase S14 [Rhizobium laguerreae]
MSAKRKVHRIGAGPLKVALLGVSTSISGMGEHFTEWVTAGMSKEAFDTSKFEVAAILVKFDRSVFFFDEYFYPSGPLECDFITIGSGHEFALGAFRAGADAFGAVEVAISCDPFCGPPIVSLQFDTPDANPIAYVERAKTMPPSPEQGDPAKIGNSIVS